MKKHKPKPITAQPVGTGFVVQQSGMIGIGHRADGKGSEQVSHSSLTSTNDGCYRRLPTCQDDR